MPLLRSLDQVLRVRMRRGFLAVCTIYIYIEGTGVGFLWLIWLGEVIGGGEGMRGMHGRVW